MGTQRLYTRHCHVLSMGNQLSTWNLTIQSAVRGPSFDEFPAYNQERIFSDYTWFYIGIGCTAGVALLLILFNFVLGCIYKKYWYSRFTGNRFTYWPFISLIVAAVMVTILLVLKFSEKLCRARLRSPHRHGGHPDQHPMDDLEMMEDGQGTMMDFNLQDSGSVRSQRTAQSQVGYSPASETGYQHREMAL